MSHDVAIAVGEIGVSRVVIGAPPCGRNDIGTAPATPILERVDAVRRRMLFLLASYRGTESIPVSFSFVSFASLSLPPVPSTPAPPSLSPPHAGMRISPSFRNTFSPAPSLTSTFAFLVPSWLSLCRFTTASRTPFPLHAPQRRRPSPARDRRANIPLAHNPSTKRAICNN